MSIDSVIREALTIALIFIDNFFHIVSLLFFSFLSFSLFPVTLAIPAEAENPSGLSRIACENPAVCHIYGRVES